VVAAIMDDPSLHFNFPEPEPLSTPILQAGASPYSPNPDPNPDPNPHPAGLLT